MALPNTDLTKSMLNKSAFVDGDPDAQAYDKRPAHHKATMDDDPRGGGPASGVMTLKQRLAARKEQVTGVRQAAAHAHYTEPEQDKEPKFQKVNLIGSMMNEHAVFSLVTQTDDITYMDLRGNGLDSAFGWKLIKAMKKQYLRLDFCNGINTKRIRENSIDDLNLTGFLSHNGLFGIEPVGAIFLAHFLRGNTSLVSIQFQRNSVGKDGSKAIAQAIIGNPDSQINEVNHMKPKKKRGVNFTKFQSKEIEEIRMANFNLVDEDIVFLEEYLSRHDCVKELDLKGNPFFGEGVRKLGRYLGVSQTLEVLRLNNVPVSLEGIQLLTKGISANQSLTWVAFPIGIAYGPSKELLQVMHQLAVALSRHPKMERWGSTPVRCDYVKNNEMGEYNMMRLLNTGYHYDVALFFWILATCKPSTKTDIEWNPVKGEGQEYPQVKPYSPALFLAISSACHQLRGHLTEITIAIAKDMTGVAQLLYYMAGSDTLKKVSLPAFANAKISFEELPKEWHDEGQLPLWFREYLTKQRRLWDALWGFVQRTKNLEQFNAVNIKDFEGDAIEFQVMLMFECQRDFVAVRESNQEISLHYGNHCEPEFPFQATRLLNPKKKYTINIEFVGKNQALIKEQQDAIALLIVAKGDGATGGPTFPQYPHNVRCLNQTTSKQLINSMEYSACLQEIYIESIETVLSVLVKSLCTPKSRENLKAIKINRFWYPSRKMPKQYSGKQIERLKMLQDWMKGSSHFTGVSSTILGDLDKQQLAKMDLHEFGDALSGLRIEEMQVQPVYQPSVAYEIFHDVYDYFYPPEEDEAEDGGPKDVWFLLPLHESFPGKFLKTIHLTNANIKNDILKMYPDQYAESSKKLWLHKNCHKKLAGDVTAMHQADGMDYDYEDFIRFHWDKDVSLGTGYNAEALSKTYLTEQRKHSKGFHNDVLMLMLKSLMESPALTDLDLRGNNFEGDDVRIIIKMLPESSLLVLNAIPLSDEGGEATELRFEAGPIELPESPDDRPEIDEYADPDYAATMSACQAWRGVRLDEGDCAIFQHLVSPKRFPNLQRIVFIKHTINESAMQFLCDALIHLKKLAEFSMVECIMSNRASSLLVHTLADLGNHLHIINDVGFGKKMSNRESAPTWVDANLGVIGRKNAWSDLSFGNSNTKDFLVERSLSDSGLRGLSSYIRFAAGSKVSQQLAEHIPKLRKVDFSYNHIVSDAVIAEFCRSLLMPGAAPDLGEIDCRYCTSLKARSAFELHHLVQRDSDHNQGSCPRLHTINGMNVKLLIMAAQDGKATAQSLKGRKGKQIKLAPPQSAVGSQVSDSRAQTSVGQNRRMARRNPTTAVKQNTLRKLKKGSQSTAAPLDLFEDDGLAPSKQTLLFEEKEEEDEEGSAQNSEEQQQRGELKRPRHKNSNSLPTSKDNQPKKRVKAGEVEQDIMQLTSTSTSSQRQMSDSEDSEKLDVSRKTRRQSPATFAAPRSPQQSTFTFGSRGQSMRSLQSSRKSIRTPVSENSPRVVGGKY
eukprot:GEMP01001046.1.p1 GENE.GEMP01001046.1~~GEMP01001046.1.p1  ORF type:complete len:1504 (+),score=273.65 GEMP01001046.1:195-4706(+)